MSRTCILPTMSTIWRIICFKYRIWRECDFISFIESFNWVGLKHFKIGRRQIGALFLLGIWNICREHFSIRVDLFWVVFGFLKRYLGINRKIGIADGKSIFLHQRVSNHTATRDMFNHLLAARWRFFRILGPNGDVATGGAIRGGFALCRYTLVLGNHPPAGPGWPKKKGKLRRATATKKADWLIDSLGAWAIAWFDGWLISARMVDR